MNAFGVLTLISGGLQLVVPSYALRLVRRFGAQSVGWFLVVAFASLGMLNLFGSDGGFGGGFSAEVVCAVGSVLLLVGMGHLETVFSERQQGESKEKALRDEWASRARTETADLARRNRELSEQVARYEQQVKSLGESERQYRALFEENPHPMWIFDLRNHRILLGNAAALKLYRYSQEEFLTLSVCDLLSESAGARFLQYAAQRCSGRENPVRWQHRRKDQELLEVEVLGIDLRCGDVPARLILADDLMPRLQREAETRNAVRFEVIGQVAAGFAHHFNNLLAVIEGNASLMTEMNGDGKSSGHLKNISVAVNRAATLTRQLLLVGGRREFHIIPADLNALLRNSCHLLRRLVGNQISIQYQHGTGLPPVRADVQQLEQVLVNLVLNARDAMPQGGVLTIATSTVVRKEATPAQDGLIRTGEFVRLTVRDTGGGMTPEVRARLFEPFFTTKDIGEASGLGLAGVYGSLKAQSGWIEITSEPGQGTECRVFLPCAPGSTPATCGDTQANGALGTILLVDPDDRTRGTARCALNWNGYRVIEADGSAIALMLWESQAAKVDLLLVEASLADGSSGSELVQRLRQTKPKLKVLFTSAMEAGVGEQFDVASRNGWVAKPYRTEQLLEAVQNALASDQGRI